MAAQGGTSRRSVRKLALIICATMLAAPDGALASQRSVTQAEIDAVVKSVEQGDAAALRQLFGPRMMFSTTAFDHELISPEAFLEAIAGCIASDVIRLDADPDVFIQWVCRDRPHQGPVNTRPGFVARIWHHRELGLSFGFSRDAVPVGPLLAPPAPRF